MNPHGPAHRMPKVWFRAHFSQTRKELTQTEITQ